MLSLYGESEFATPPSENQTNRFNTDHESGPVELPLAEHLPQENAIKETHVGPTLAALEGLTRPADRLPAPHLGCKEALRLEGRRSWS